MRTWLVVSVALKNCGGERAKCLRIWDCQIVCSSCSVVLFLFFWSCFLGLVDFLSCSVSRSINSCVFGDVVYL